MSRFNDYSRGIDTILGQIPYAIIFWGIIFSPILFIFLVNIVGFLLILTSPIWLIYLGIRFLFRLFKNDEVEICQTSEGIAKADAALPNSKAVQEEQYAKWSEKILQDFEQKITPLRNQKIRSAAFTLSSDSYPIVNKTYVEKELKKALEKEESCFEVELNRKRFVNCYAWLVFLESSYHNANFKNYNLDTLERAKKDYLTLGRKKAGEIWFDAPNVLVRLQKDFKKDMNEAPYWRSKTKEERQKALSRLLKEVQMDLEHFGPEKTMSLWLGFIKKEEQKRISTA